MRVSAWITIALLCTAQASADFNGRVTDKLRSDAIEGVEITIQSGTGTSTVHTDSQGRFSLDLQPPFDLHLMHDLYQPYRGVILGTPDQTRHFELLGLNDIPLTGEEKSALTTLRSNAGDALYVFPYQLTAVGVDLSGFDTTLIFNLRRNINTYLQARNAPTIAVVSLPESLRSHPNRTALYGAELNALAMIDGIGTPASAESVMLQSEYQIVPARGGVIYVDDVFTKKQMQAGLLASKLHKLWAQITFLSIASRDYVRATSGSAIDDRALVKIRDSLLDYRSDLPLEDEQLLGRIDALLQKIEGSMGS